MNVLNQTNLSSNKLIARFDSRLNIYGIDGVRYCIGSDGLLYEALKPVSAMSLDLSDTSSWFISNSGVSAATLQDIRDIPSPYDGMIAHFLGDLPTHKYYIFSSTIAAGDADLVPSDGSIGGWSVLNTGSSGGSMELATFRLNTTNSGLSVTFSDGSTSKSLPKADMAYSYSFSIPENYAIQSYTINDSHSTVSINTDDLIMTFSVSPESASSITVSFTLVLLADVLSKQRLLDNSTSSDLNSLKNQLFDIRYDGDAYHRISDGRNDTYDNGNQVYFNYGSGYVQRDYTSSGTSDEVGYVYRTRGMMVWQGTNVIACKTDGNLGSDGNTRRTEGGGTFTVNNRTVYYKYVWSDDDSPGTSGDPRILRMVLSFNPVDSVSYNGANNDSDRHEFLWNSTQDAVVFAQFWFYQNNLSYTYEQMAKILIGAL